MNRFPDGIGRIAIQQKRVPNSFPSWIKRATVDRHQGRTITQALIDNSATLVYLANYNMITTHVWLSRIQAAERPDQLIFDLDPSNSDVGLVRTTALNLKALLEEIRLVPFVKTPRSCGLHVVVPITVGPGFEEAHLFADHVARRLAASDRGHLTTEFIKQKREGRLFIDVNRNAYAQTAVSRYSVRARAAAPIAVPIAWSDVESDTLRPDSVTIRNVWNWRRDHDDPWKQMDDSRSPLPRLKESDKPNRSPASGAAKTLQTLNREASPPLDHRGAGDVELSCAELLHQAERVETSPAVCHFPVDDPEDADALEHHRFASRGDARERAQVRPPKGASTDHAGAFGDQICIGYPKVGKSAKQHRETPFECPSISRVNGVVTRPTSPEPER